MLFQALIKFLSRFVEIKISSIMQMVHCNLRYFVCVLVLCTQVNMVWMHTQSNITNIVIFVLK
jgi:hypothetical protein